MQGVDPGDNNDPSEIFFARYAAGTDGIWGPSPKKIKKNYKNLD